MTTAARRPSAALALRRTWRVREYIVASVKRDFRTRYLGTQLGFFWVIAQPLALILIYTLVFAQIMKPSMPGHPSRYAYSIALCAGLIVWQLFSQLLTRSVAMFVQNADVLKKVSLPRLALPVVVTLSSVLDFAIILALFVAFLLLTGNGPGGKPMLALLPVVGIAAAFAVGLGVLLGTLNVFYRDVEQATTLVLGFWFWLTPIVYPERAIPEALMAVFGWNPLWPLVRFSQTLFLEGRIPPWSDLAYPAVAAMIVLLLGLTAYRRLGADIPDEL